MRYYIYIMMMTSLLAWPAVGSAESDESSSGPESKFTILYMADLHGQIQPHLELFWFGQWRGGSDETNMAGGLPRMAAFARKVRQQQGRPVICIDAGDTIQGSAIAAWTEGAAVVEPMNGIGLDVALPGNWSVVYGPEVFKKRARQFNYQIIAANIFDKKSGDRLFPAYYMKEHQGAKVAVIGYTDPDIPTRQPPSYSEGLSYKDHKILQPLIDEVRHEKQADVVLLLTHIGLSKAVYLADQLQGVDIVLSGDTHERTDEPIVRGQTWVVEPGAFGSFVGQLDLTVRDGRLAEREWKLIRLQADEYPEDSQVARAMADNIDPYRDRLNEVIGHTTETLLRYNVVETNLDKILADALREAADAEIAISNGFRFAHPVPAGEITTEHLYDWYPINEPLKTGKVTGRQLRQFWENELEHVFAKDPLKLFNGWVPRPSGMVIRFVAGQEKGSRLREITVGGQPLQDERLYTVVACRREGEPDDTLCRIKGVKDTRVLDLKAHQAVRDYLAAHDPVTPPSEVRVQALDLPKTVHSQYYAIEYLKNNSRHDQPRQASAE